MNEGGIERLMYISRSSNGIFSEKVIRYARQVSRNCDFLLILFKY